MLLVLLKLHLLSKSICYFWNLTRLNFTKVNNHCDPFFTDRVRSTTGRLCFDMCLSSHPSIRLTVPQPGPAWVGGGGTPARCSLEVYPRQRWGTPLARYDRRYLRWGTPPSPDRDGVPSQYRTTDGVLDTPRLVCLLRSRRRTFLFKMI